jgi:hypothetical protein
MSFGKKNIWPTDILALSYGQQSHTACDSHITQMIIDLKMQNGENTTNNIPSRAFWLKTIWPTGTAAAL